MKGSIKAVHCVHTANIYSVCQQVLMVVCVVQWLHGTASEINPVQADFRQVFVSQWRLLFLTFFVSFLLLCFSCHCLGNLNSSSDSCVGWKLLAAPVQDTCIVGLGTQDPLCKSLLNILIFH